MSSKPASDKQVAFVRSLLSERYKSLGLGSVEEAMLATDAANMDMAKIRVLIDRLLAMPKDADPSMPDVVHQSKRYGTGNRAGLCYGCHDLVPDGAGYYFLDGDGKWSVHHKLGECIDPSMRPKAVGIDISMLPTGLYADPEGDTRLKVSVKHGTGKWAGTIFVNDAAVYGFNGRLGRQEAGSLYIGKAMDVLARITADPLAALKAYADITNHCGFCGRDLEDVLSVEMGIGPVCSDKHGFGAQRAAIAARLKDEGKL